MRVHALMLTMRANTLVSFAFISFYRAAVVFQEQFEPSIFNTFHDIFQLNVRLRLLFVCCVDFYFIINICLDSWLWELCE